MSRECAGPCQHCAGPWTRAAACVQMSTRTTTRRHAARPVEMDSTDLRFIVVTDRAGAIAAAGIRELARAGARVRALVRTRWAAAALGAGCRLGVVETDLTRADTLARALGPKDRVLLVTT